jgi:hypothetical protein
LADNSILTMQSDTQFLTQNGVSKRSRAKVLLNIFASSFELLDKVLMKALEYNFWKDKAILILAYSILFLCSKWRNLIKIPS